MVWNFDILVAIFCSTLCWVTGLLLLRRLPVPFRLLVVQAFLSSSMDVFGVVAINVFGYHNNQFFFNLYMPLEFLLMLFAVRANLGKHFRLFATISILIFAVSWILALSINGIHQFANQALIVYGILLTIAYFLVLLRNVQEDRSLYTTGIYFISVSVILYYCCTIPHFGLIHYLEHSESRMAGNYLNSALNCLRYLFTTVGLVFLSRPVIKPAVHAY